MRVFELAKKIGMTSKELMAILAKMGVEAKNHMSTLDDADVRVLSERYVKKGADKKGAAAAVALAVPERKSRVLIKKPRAPEPAALVGASGSVEEAESHVEPISPVEMAEKIEEKILPQEGVAAVMPTEFLSIPNPSLVPPAATVAEGPAGAGTTAKSEAEKKEREKKKGKTENARKDLSPKAKGFKKEKEKTRKPDRWVVPEELPTSEIVAEAAAEPGLEPLSEIPAVAPEVVEGRKWQDFKPIHRKEDRSRNAARRAHPTALSDITKPRRKVIKLHEGLTVKEFAELIGQKPSVVIGRLMEMGTMATVNQAVDLNAATLIAEAFGLKCEVVADRTEEEILTQGVEERPANRVPRPPVITIMGHVDHGKTSLLDAIRQTRVTEGEAGGITQHIGAYAVKVGEKQVTFLDTPGHEAFTAMRARGAKVTDVVLLVVAADDGVMPQTVEAINHAKAAGVPIIVVMNKIDKPEANAERVKHALSEYELIPEEWGGKTIFAEVSAKKRIGLDHLLEMILLQAEVLELKSDPTKPPRGTIVEAKIDRGRGPVATVLVQEGTLRVGDAFVTGQHFGKVRALINDAGQKVQEAGPSVPVEVIGLDGVPQAGDDFQAVSDERVAKEVASARQQRQRTIDLAKVNRVTLDQLYTQISEGIIKELSIIIKADVQGSVEAIKEALEKIPSTAVKLRVIHGGVGGITETDVLLASASDAIVIGFNVRPEPNAEALAEREKVDIRYYNIIYNAVADITAAMEGLLAPTLKERVLGRVEVRQVFNIPKIGAIAGGYVTEGTVSRSSAGARVLRDSVVVYEGKVSSLRRFKDDVREVQAGYECGIGIEKFNDIKTGDIIEVFTF